MGHARRGTMDARLGTEERPVRVAVVGAGPAGFFTADALLRRDAPVFDVDVFGNINIIQIAL